MALSNVTIQNHDFISDNKKWKYIGIDGFALPIQYLTGGEAAVRPYFDQWDSIKSYTGFTRELVTRSFVVAAPPNSFAINPHEHSDFYQKILSLVNYANGRGYRMDLTGGDYQIVMPNVNGDDGQQKHINEMEAMLVSASTTNFLQGCNEPFNNGMNVNQITFSKWGNYLISSGAYGPGKTDYYPVEDFIDFHPDRATGEWFWPKFLYDLPVSAAVIQGWFPVPAIFGEPIGFDEVNIEGRRSNRTDYANMMGRIAEWLAGVTFHYTAGVTGNLMGEVTKNCAIEFLWGAAKVS